MSVPDYLALKNPHPRDEHISFEEEGHIYTVLGERNTYTSATTWNHRHFPHFDEKPIIENILKSKKMKDPNYTYYNKTAADIKKMWDDNRDRAAGEGTKMHYDIECYYNQIEVQNDSVEFGYFKKFVNEFPDLKPYRTEWMVYYEEYKISGSIDMIFEKPDGSLLIYDWKRCKEIEYENNFGKQAITPCISHFPDTNFWHYTLQLNIYKKILEEKYGKKVTDLYLVCLHPDNWNKSFQRIEVPVIEKEINDLFELRKQELANGIIGGGH